MKRPFRVIDTGVRDGRRQIAFDQALIELHKAGRSPDTVRFMRFPATVLIGRHQAMAHEVRLDHCRDNGIGLVRRITGGGAIYLDEGQVGWELVLSRKRWPLATLGDYTRAIAKAVAFGLAKRFAIDAVYRPRTDIEVDGCKLCGTGGFFDGDTLIYQGTVLVDVEPGQMLACLNVPEAKPAVRALDRAGSRLVTLKALSGGRTPDVIAVHDAVRLGLAEKLGLSLLPGAPTGEEEALADQLHRDEIGTDAFTFEIDAPGGAEILEASRQTAGGKVSAYLRLEGRGGARRIREILLTGDFFVLPPRVIYDLEARLRGVSVNAAGPTIDAFLAQARPDTLTLAPADIRSVVAAALASDAGN